MVRAHDASYPSDGSHILRRVLKRARYAMTYRKAVAGANHLREITIIDSIRHDLTGEFSVVVQQA